MVATYTVSYSIFLRKFPILLGKFCTIYLPIILFLIFGKLVQAQTAHREYLCPHFIIIGNLNPSLSDVERRLICGDPEVNSKIPNEGWRTIPATQAKYNFTNFIQRRGYLHPIFHMPTLAQPELIVELGQKTLVSRIIVQGAGDAVKIERKRKVMGEPLTPALLDILEKWTLEQLNHAGYACPKVKSQGDSDTGEVIIQVNTGALQYIATVTRDAIPGMNQDALARYDAFQIGRSFWKFDGELLTLTSNRIASVGVVESAHFTRRCEGDQVHLNEEIIAGAPRLLIGGVGMNTEGLLNGKVSWRNTRLGSMGSLLDVTAAGSAKLQSLVGSLNYYFLPYVSRYSLNPLLQFSHDNEEYFETLAARGQLGISTTQDFNEVGTSFFFGPTLDFFSTLRGIGPPNSHLLSLETNINLKSHEYEYYISNPRTGYAIGFTLDINDRNFYSNISAQRFNLTGEALWNVNNYDPPLWILGFRAGYSTVVTGEVAGQSSALPVSFLKFLGGSTNLRGFGRQELPLNGIGGLTSGFLDLEARLTHTLPYNFDLIFFLDVGAIGSRPSVLDLPIYWSPGLGLRWGSPIGVLRTTLAHGYSNLNPNHLQFYFSYGEEF